MSVDFDLYKRLLENRPFKFAPEDVNYRNAEGKEHCGDCVHFYTRNVDGFHTCEIMRTDGDDSIIENYRCDFWTDDGEEYPYQEE